MNLFPFESSSHFLWNTPCWCWILPWLRCTWTELPPPIKDWPLILSSKWFLLLSEVWNTIHCFFEPSIKRWKSTILTSCRIWPFWWKTNRQRRLQCLHGEAKAVSLAQNMWLPLLKTSKRSNTWRKRFHWNRCTGALIRFFIRNPWTKSIIDVRKHCPGIDRLHPRHRADAPFIAGDVDLSVLKQTKDENENTPVNRSEQLHYSIHFEQCLCQRSTVERHCFFVCLIQQFVELTHVLWQI